MTQLDTLIGAWTSRYEADLLLEILDKNDIPSCKVYTAADCAQDAQYRARGMVRDVPDKHFGSVLQAGIVPHVPESPGCVRWTGPDRSEEHTSEIQSLMSISYAVFCLKKKKNINNTNKPINRYVHKAIHTVKKKH